MLEWTNNSVIIQNWKVLVIASVSSVVWFLWSTIRSKSSTAPVHEHVVKRLVDGEEYIGELPPAADETAGAHLDQPSSSHLDDKPHIPFVGATVTLPDGADQFYAMANDRRSVRKYNSQRPVALSVIERCIHAAGTSPSGAHTEPWTFCLVQDARVKGQVREIIEAEEYLNYKQRMARQWTVDLTPLKTDYVKEYITDAPFLILVFKQTYGNREDGTRQQHYYHEISTAIATGILLSALQSAGLSSLVTTPLNCGPALRQLLQRPPNEKLLVLLPVGYPADDCLIPDLQRKPLDQIMVKY